MIYLLDGTTYWLKLIKSLSTGLIIQLVLIVHVLVQWIVIYQLAILIHWINHHPPDQSIGFRKIYPQDGTIQSINPYSFDNSIDFGGKTTKNQGNLLDFTHSFLSATKTQQNDIPTYPTLVLNLGLVILLSMFNSRIRTFLLLLSGFENLVLRHL